ncbi:redox-sensitive transcriptional activator SoxR [Planktotalea arctica]|uniref:redox-sensitive transcriptional activator SoxR n=1 Tax=Planktotalea arctica TaxID=1481893 RepID=UPI0032192AC7
MTLKNSELTIGQMAKRTGLAVSAIRYYETEGLITANRNRGGHRRFARAQVRRVSFILIAQKFNLTLPQIKEVLRQLPDGRTPNAKDWADISQEFRRHLDQQITDLERIRDSLDGCIGCGCLSLNACALYNPEDRLSAHGSGPVISLNLCE